MQVGDSTYVGNRYKPRKATHARTLDQYTILSAEGQNGRLDMGYADS